MCVIIINSDKKLTTAEHTLAMLMMGTMTMTWNIFKLIMQNLEIQIMVDLFSCGRGWHWMAEINLETWMLLIILGGPNPEF